MTKRWHNEPGTLTRKLEKYEGVEWRDENDKGFTANTERLLDAAFPAIGSGKVEMVIDFQSSGYHFAGTMYARNGDPGDPPESDEERSIEDITIDGKTISDELLSALKKEYATEVDDEPMQYD